MPRREFLAVAAAGSGSLLLAPDALGADSGLARPAPRRDLLPRPRLDRVGVQLYTVRALAAEDMAATLEAVRAAGYDEVEFAGWFGHAPATLRRWLDESGLAAPAAHVGAEDLSGAGLDASVEAATVLGMGWLVLPWIPDSQRSPDGYRAAADALNAAGEAVQSAGLRVGYHNHAFEFDPLPADGGRTGFDVLLERLDPAFVDVEIDFHWSTVGGVDPAALFAAHPGRFALCHLKDLDAQGRMTDVGSGRIDWDAIFALSDQAGLRHYFVEHDQPADPLASIGASWRYLKGR